jgi:hypothetical protein
MRGVIEVSITDRMYDELDKIIFYLLSVVQRGLYPEPTNLEPDAGIAATEIFSKR